MLVGQPQCFESICMQRRSARSAGVGAKNCSIPFGGCPALCRPTPPQDPENLIINGSFETPVLALGANYYQPTNCLGPWQTDGSCFEIWAPNVPAEFAADGRQHLEILSTTGGGTSVWQTVTTVVGDDYRLSFHHSPRPTILSTLTASINGQVIATFDE